MVALKTWKHKNPNPNTWIPLRSLSPKLFTFIQSDWWPIADNWQKGVLFGLFSPSVVHRSQWQAVVLARGELRGGLLHGSACVRLCVPQQELAGYVCTCVLCLSRMAAFGLELTDVMEALGCWIWGKTDWFLQGSAVVERVLVGAQCHLVVVLNNVALAVFLAQRYILSLEFLSCRLKRWWTIFNRHLGKSLKMLCWPSFCSFVLHVVSFGYITCLTHPMIVLSLPWLASVFLCLGCLQVCLRWALLLSDSRMYSFLSQGSRSLWALSESWLVSNSCGCLIQSFSLQKYTRTINNSQL